VKLRSSPVPTSGAGHVQAFRWAVVTSGVGEGEGREWRLYIVRSSPPGSSAQSGATRGPTERNTLADIPYAALKIPAASLGFTHHAHTAHSNSVICTWDAYLLIKMLPSCDICNEFLTALLGLLISHHNRFLENGSWSRQYNPSADGMPYT
jgi:hypothetical protein